MLLRKDQPLFTNPSTSDGARQDLKEAYERSMFDTASQHELAMQAMSDEIARIRVELGRRLYLGGFRSGEVNPMSPDTFRREQELAREVLRTHAETGTRADDGNQKVLDLLSQMTGFSSPPASSLALTDAAPSAAPVLSSISLPTGVFSPIPAAPAVVTLRIVP